MVMSLSLSKLFEDTSRKFFKAKPTIFHQACNIRYLNVMREQINLSVLVIENIETTDLSKIITTTFIILVTTIILLHHSLHCTAITSFVCTFSNENLSSDKFQTPKEPKNGLLLLTALASASTIFCICYADHMHIVEQTTVSITWRCSKHNLKCQRHEYPA